MNTQTVPDWGWQDAAACRGADLVLFFGPPGEKQADRDRREPQAKQVCSRCPVRIDCLNYAISKPEVAGVWGGRGEQERVSERRRQQRRAKAA